MRKPRLEGEGARDVHALALSARELVRIAPDELGRVEPYHGEELARPIPRRSRRYAVHLRAEHDGVLDGQARVERGVGVLEHHLHLPAELAKPGRVVRDDVASVELDLACVGADEVHEKARRRRLAASRFADDAEHFSGLNGEADVVDRLHPCHGAVEDPAPDREVLAKVLDLEQCGRTGAARRTGAWAAIAHARRPRAHSRTSIALRSPSLSRLKVSEVKKIITPGRAATHGLT